MCHWPSLLQMRCNAQIRRRSLAHSAWKEVREKGEANKKKEEREKGEKKEAEHRSRWSTWRYPCAIRGRSRRRCLRWSRPRLDFAWGHEAGHGLSRPDDGLAARVEEARGAAPPPTAHASPAEVARRNRHHIGAAIVQQLRRVGRKGSPVRLPESQRQHSVRGRFGRRRGGSCGSDVARRLLVCVVRCFSLSCTAQHTDRSRWDEASTKRSKQWTARRRGRSLAAGQNAAT